jgi:hypothetical protein
LIPNVLEKISRELKKGIIEIKSEPHLVKNKK